jgi:ATP-binding cassette, subfamily F, member 3
VLNINDITYRLGPRLLFDQAGVAIPEGSRIGLVGRNGTGKTTLFRLIRGETSLEGGSITMPKGLKIGGVAQEGPPTPNAPI